MKDECRLVSTKPQRRRQGCQTATLAFSSAGDAARATKAQWLILQSRLQTNSCFRDHLTLQSSLEKEAKCLKRCNGPSGQELAA